MAAVYVDIVFLINGIVSLLILLITKKLVHLKSGWPRLISASILCSVYTVLMLFPSFKICFTILGRLVFSVILMLIAFKLSDIKTLIRAVMTFYIATFAFGGAVYGAAQLLQRSSPMPMIVLALSTASAYFLILFVSRCRQAALAKAKHIVNVTVSICGQEKTLPCLVDTGNSLSSPIFQKPVTVVEMSEIKSILPENIAQLTVSYTPYRSVGSDSGALLTVKSDWLAIGAHKANSSLIGIYNGCLSTDGTYKGLINPVLMEEVTENENLCSKPEKHIQQTTYQTS